MVLGALFTSRLQCKIGHYMCLFQVFLWLLVTFLSHLDTRHIPKKVNLNLIIF